MSDKPPVGLRPRWLVLSDRADEIKAAMQRYEAQGLLCPDEWLIELQDIERQQAILDPPKPAPSTAVAVPRRFVSISRTVSNNFEDHILDAIDDEGIAWWMVAGGNHGWQELTPLPAREVPAQ